MKSHYLRLPQHSSDLLYARNEKEGNGQRPESLSWKNLIVSLSVVINVLLSVLLVLMLRDKPTPIGFGENRQAIFVEVATDRSQPRSTLLRPHGINSGGILPTAPKTTPTATGSGKPFYHLMVSWPWTANGRNRDSGRRRCTYQAITAKVSTCWKPIISCIVW